ncbi:DNA primase [Oceaniovalibus guishaninsula JLT2003]|uniref:DNA primase n=1 Tax=Oceaniovalibus guishaninsula JLT2003 TaxID=1231392 RepID=K2HHC6_9RHOB|nr:DNA primase [Oceaniovalibus guishaninsula]EKE45837.1 DNA primase [Oceaniovalibus guishaninsula JLT2003]
MSLPPTFLDELRDRVSLSAVVGRKVIWDARKSNQGRGDMWAPCPFHQEKTASFHVDDRKGFYYCFGCHQKGSVFDFVMATENLGFMEAVARLAAEAGMTMPQRDPRAAEREDKASRLIDVTEAAARWFRLQLASAAGRPARDYLARRGLDKAAQARWGLGLAPDGWRGLCDHLTGQGIDDRLLLEAGLARKSQNGGAPYDVFRNRLIFPIRDGRDRTIAFGGRALDPADNAKYLNSPQTPIFDKGRTLYNVGPARAAAGREGPLIVAEGYMDVIALSEAGFPATVAPLGTAITPDHLAMLWRIHPEPVLALDGDRAGRQAALRTIDLALPLIEAGRSLRICLLPGGQDPDDLLKSAGRDAMREVLAGAEPPVALIWRRETEGRVFDSPERRAALERRLNDIVGRIRDGSIRRHYQTALRELSWQHFNPRRTKASQRAAPPPPIVARQSGAGALPDTTLRESVVLALLLRYPALCIRFAAEMERMEFLDAAHARIAAAIRRLAPDCDSAMLADRVAHELGDDSLEKMLSLRHLGVVPALKGNDPDLAAECLADEIGKLIAGRGLLREIDEAMEDFDALADEALTWRLRQAVDAMERSRRGQVEDRTEFDVAPNGVRISRDERSAFDGLLDRIGAARSSVRDRRT